MLTKENTMNAAQQLTEKELTNIQQNLDKLSIQQQKGEKSIKEVIEYAQEKRELLRNTLDRTQEPSELRKSVWKDINDLIFLLEKEIGPEFGPNDPLSISARKKVADAVSAINKMSMDGKTSVTPEEARYSQRVRDNSVSDEEYALLRLRMLNDYGKGIHKDHPELKKAYEKYYAKQADNYMEYAKSMVRNPNRDTAIANKVRRNADKYGPETTQAILNLLEANKPSQEGSDEQE